MDYKLELVLIPVTDVDRAKKFYLENMGGPHPDRENYQSFADFTDPDGNIWLLQEVDRGKS
jgi:hypothetical protein